MWGVLLYVAGLVMLSVAPVLGVTIAGLFLCGLIEPDLKDAIWWIGWSPEINEPR